MASVRLLKNGAAAFPVMYEAIDTASSFVALEMYIIADDATGREYRDRLIAAARRGAEVMVLVDSWGSWDLPDTFWDELRAAGGRVRWFRPIAKGLLWFRDHRKLLLIDESAAYLGGMNIADEYYHGATGSLPWRDNMLEITGEEVAWLRVSFMRMWDRAGSRFARILFRRYRTIFKRSVPEQQVRFLESGPENPLQPVRRAYRQIITSARREIDLAMSYFYPHGRMLRALKNAAKRGVRVRLLFPRITDVPLASWAARGLYGRLLRAGVEVWEYLPAMLHAKLAIADDTVIAGSANLDIRSGRINYELVAVVADAQVAAEARADFEDDLKQSDRVRIEEWRKRPLLQKLKERLSFCLLVRADIFFARLEMARGKK